MNSNNNNNALKKKNPQQLEEIATRFLHEHGYAWNGDTLEEAAKRAREHAWALHNRVNKVRG